MNKVRFSYWLATTNSILLISIASLTGYLSDGRAIAQAQAPAPNLPPGILDPERRPLEPIPETLPTPLPTPDLTVPQPIPPTPDSIPAAKVRVDRIEVLGSTVFSQSDFDKLLAPWLGKELSFEQLLEIRTTITDLYTSKGYATSGAFLPLQDLQDGILRVQVVEGELERVEITGLKRLKESYVRSRISLATNSPLNIHRLEAALQLLQLDPLFSQVQAELKAGSASGRNVLAIALTEAPALHAAYQLDNGESPNVGSTRHRLAVSHNNFLGLGDRFVAEYGLTEGDNSYDLGYEIPLNPKDGTLSFRYSKGNQTVIEEPFAPLDLNGNAQTISVGFRQPLRQTPTNEFAVGLSLDFRRSQTFLFGDIPFSFSPGPENGRSQVAVLRLTQDWSQRSRNQVLAARSQFSFGLDAFGATVNDTGIDGRFVSWVGQFQWVRALGEDTTLVARVGTQLTPDSLLPLEQFSIGGFDTVRGYRQNQLLGDNGVVGNLEVQFQVVDDPDGVGSVQLTPFFDFGRVWNHRGETLPDSTLMSVGLGLRWQREPGFSATLDWGIPLNRIDRLGDSLQDNGIYFSIRWQPF